MFEYLSVIDANESGISWLERSITHTYKSPEKREKNKKGIEFYVTVTKRNLISFRFIRLYNFPKFSLCLCIHNNGCSQHCCYTMANKILLLSLLLLLLLLRLCVWPTSKRMFLLPLRMYVGVDVVTPNALASLINGMALCGMVWHCIVFVNCGGSFSVPNGCFFFAPQCNCHTVAHFETLPTAYLCLLRMRESGFSIDK